MRRRRRQEDSGSDRSARPRGHLRRRPAHHDRALRRQPAALELGRRARGQRRGGGRVSQPPAGAAPPVAAHQLLLDLDRPAALDQLLADGPGQRLEGLGPPPRAQPGPAADDRAQQRVAPEGAVKVRQVLVDAEREVHPLEPVPRPRLARLGRGPHPHRAARHPGPHLAGRALRMQQAPQDGALAAQHAVAAASGQLPGPPGDEVLFEGERGYRRSSRWTSTRNERLAAISSLSPPRRLRARRTSRLDLGRRRTFTSTNAATPSRKPLVAAATAGSSETSSRRCSSADPSPSTGAHRPLDGD